MYKVDKILEKRQGATKSKYDSIFRKHRVSSAMGRIWKRRSDMVASEKFNHAERCD